jgi:UDP-glucose 4-epimerase
MAASVDETQFNSLKLNWKTFAGIGAVSTVYFADVFLRASQKCFWFDDIADHAHLLKALRGVDAVMHFAGSAYVGESIANPRKYFHNNVESGLKLIDTVLASDVRLFIFSSSCATYGVRSTCQLRSRGPRANQPVWRDEVVHGTGSFRLSLLAWTAACVPAIFQCRRRGDPPALYADTSLARRVLDWAPEFDLEFILRSAWEWETQGLLRLLPAVSRR